MFNNESLFALALQIKEPLYVKHIEFQQELGELHMYIDFRKGAKFRCSVCGKEELPVYDTLDKTWRHLNFFQYKAFIHYRTPRSNCPEHGPHLVETPWGSPGGGFTLLFEAMVMELAKYMAIKQVATIVGEHDTLIWRMVTKHVDAARKDVDYSEVTSIGIDETATRRGHNYVTLFVDMDQSQVIHVVEGKDSETIRSFKEDLPRHQGNPTNITNICADMSPAFQRGIHKYFPRATMTFDKFHVIKLMNKAVDKVRREEQKVVPALKSTRYIWLYNPSHLTAKKAAKLTSLQQMNLKTAKAYRIKLTLQDIYNTATDRTDAMIQLHKFYTWGVRCRLGPVVDFAKTLKNNWIGILNYFDSRLTNAVLEGTNSIIQSVRSRAKGYRKVKNFITMIYLMAGKLTFNFQQKIKQNQLIGQPKIG